MALSGSPPPTRLPPWLHVAHAESRQLLHPFHKAGLPARAKWKSLHKNTTRTLEGSAWRPPPAPHLQGLPPSGFSWISRAVGQDNGGYFGLHGVFKALAGPHSWGTRGPDLCKAFLKLLLLILWWTCPNLSRQALRPRGMSHKRLLLQEALRAAT